MGNRFIFEAPPPDASTIPEDDLLDVTVILLTCSYKEQEFIRIGYYVHNEYEHDELAQNDENIQINPDKIQRNILQDKPRVTRFNIAWDGDMDNKDTVNVNVNECGDETKENENENDEQYADEEEEENEDEEAEDADESEEDDADLVEEDLEETELSDMLKKKKKKGKN